MRMATPWDAKATLAAALADRAKRKAMDFDRRAGQGSGLAATASSATAVAGSTIPRASSAASVGLAHPGSRPPAMDSRSTGTSLGGAAEPTETESSPERKRKLLQALLFAASTKQTLVQRVAAEAQQEVTQAEAHEEAPMEDASWGGSSVYSTSIPSSLASSLTSSGVIPPVRSTRTLGHGQIVSLPGQQDSTYSTQVRSGGLQQGRTSAQKPAGSEQHVAHVHGRRSPPTLVVRQPMSHPGFLMGQPTPRVGRAELGRAQVCMHMRVHALSRPADTSAYAGIC